MCENPDLHNKFLKQQACGKISNIFCIKFKYGAYHRMNIQETKRPWSIWFRLKMSRVHSHLVFDNKTNTYDDHYSTELCNGRNVEPITYFAK